MAKYITYTSPKGGYYWSVADWEESIKDLANKLEDKNMRQLFLGVLASMVVISPSELPELYTKVLRRKLVEIEHGN